MKKDYKKILENKFENIQFPEINKATEKIKFFCKKHNISFCNTPVELLRDRKKIICKKCSIEQELKNTKKEIVDIIFEKHRTKVIVHCDICNNNYIHNKDSLTERTKCPFCSKWTKEKLIKIGREKYGNKYDYSNSIVIDYNTKVEIKCNTCQNIFWQVPNNHIYGKGGCQFCNGGRKYTTEEILQKLNNRFYTDEVVYTGIYNKIILTCKKCGKKFSSIPNNIIHNNEGCPYCNFSKGEKIIEEVLQKNNIKYEIQKKFKDLKDRSFLSYDFYLPKENLLIEYNGEQYYKNIFDKPLHEFHRQLHHDWLKRKYANKKGIVLLTIPFWDYNNIESIMQKRILTGAETS